MKTNLRIIAGLLTVSLTALAEISPDQLISAQKKITQCDYAGALNLLDRVIAEAPNSAEGYFLRATAREKQRDTIGALVDYDAAIRLGVAEHRYYVARADLLLALDRYQAAVDDYDRAIALRPVEYVGYQKRAAAFSRMQNFTKALADFDLAIKLNSREPETYALRIQTLLAMDDQAAALAGVNEMIALFPSCAKAFHLRSRMSAAVHERRNAVADLDAAIQLSPDEPVYYKERALLRSMLGNGEGAQADVVKYNALVRAGRNKPSYNVASAP